MVQGAPLPDSIAKLVSVERVRELLICDDIDAFEKSSANDDNFVYLDCSFI